MTDIVDPFHVKGIDGILRPLSKHCDSKGDVEQDPYGAWLAIQNQATEIERLRRTIDAAFKLGRIVGFLGEDEGLIEAFREECGPELLARVRAALIDKEAGDGTA